MSNLPCLGESLAGDRGDHLPPDEFRKAESNTYNPLELSRLWKVEDTNLGPVERSSREPGAAELNYQDLGDEGRQPNDAEDTVTQEALEHG